MTRTFALGLVLLHWTFGLFAHKRYELFVLYNYSRTLHTLPSSSSVFLLIYLTDSHSTPRVLIWLWHVHVLDSFQLSRIHVQVDASLILCCLQ